MLNIFTHCQIWLKTKSKKHACMSTSFLEFPRFFFLILILFVDFRENKLTSDLFLFIGRFSIELFWVQLLVWLKIKDSIRRFFKREVHRRKDFSVRLPNLWWFFVIWTSEYDVLLRKQREENDNIKGFFSHEVTRWSEKEFDEKKHPCDSSFFEINDYLSLINWNQSISDGNSIFSHFTYVRQSIFPIDANISHYYFSLKLINNFIDEFVQEESSQIF